MSYADGEALVLQRVQNLESFNTRNTSRGNWNILNSGASDHYAVLRPGSFERMPITVTVFQSNWQTIVEVWQRYKDDQTSLTDLQSLVTEVIGEIDEYHLLADTEGNVQDALPRSAGDILQIGPPDSPPKWLKWELIVDWKEETTISFKE